MSVNVSISGWNRLLFPFPKIGMGQVMLNWIFLSVHMLLNLSIWWPL